MCARQFAAQAPINKAKVHNALQINVDVSDSVDTNEYIQTQKIKQRF